MLKKGDRVRVMIPLSELTASVAVKKFNGTVTTIKKRIQYRGRGMYFDTFQLEGCESEHGNSYEFCEEWIIPLDEEDEVRA